VVLLETVIGRKMDKQAQEISQNYLGTDVQRVGEGIVTFDRRCIKFITNQSTLNASSKATLDKLVSNGRLSRD
jgi:outer membrane protein OmpA-like peptidoglycan-associated protein